MLVFALRPRVSAVLAALVATGLVTAACTGGTNAVDQTAGGDYRYVGATTKGHLIPEKDRKTAGNASAPLLDGTGTWNLTALKGQVVLVNYWATYCGPCVIETPALDKIYRAMKSDGVSFVGIDTKEVSPSKAKAFIADNNVSYPIVLDQTAKTALEIGRLPASALPNTVLIDKQGRVAAVYVGAVAAGDIQPVLTTLSAEK